MKWDRSETIGLAKPFCVTCKGVGQKPNVKERSIPCNCVLRAIFRACYARFRDCVSKEKFMSKVSLVPCRGKEQTQSYARLDEDYIADFCLVSQKEDAAVIERLPISTREKERISGENARELIGLS